MRLVLDTNVGDRKHLLPLGNHDGIPIITPAEALRRFEAQL